MDMPRKPLVKPKPKTLKDAEKDLKNPKASQTAKGTGGYTLRNAKGVRENVKKGKKK